MVEKANSHANAARVIDSLKVDVVDECLESSEE